MFDEAVSVTPQWLNEKVYHISRNLSEANGMKVQITDKRFSLKKNAKNYMLLVNLL